MRTQTNIIDSHVHLDLTQRYLPERIQWLKDNGCGVVSWAYFEGVDSVSRLEECLESKAQCIRQHAAAGLKCYYLTGIHPRSIPPDLKPGQIRSLLEPCLEDPLCKGIGEIGLETGDAREQEVLIAQLEVGRSYLSQGKVIGVHTPRINKLSVTQTTLEILKAFPEIRLSIVVDHCTAETVGAVLDAGAWAGVTLSPVKTSLDEMKRIVSFCSDRIDRVMCNTDSGGKFYEDVVQFRRNSDLPEPIRAKIFYGNAARFFAVQWSKETVTEGLLTKRRSYGTD